MLSILLWGGRRAGRNYIKFILRVLERFVNLGRQLATNALNARPREFREPGNEGHALFPLASFLTSEFGNLPRDALPPARRDSRIEGNSCCMGWDEVIVWRSGELSISW